MEAAEVMSLEDMDPGLRAGQMWKWKNPVTGHEGLYFLLADRSTDDDDITWETIDLINGDVKYVYSVGQSTSWKRLV